MIPAIMHPKSRGRITLRTVDPFDHPDIDPNYLNHPDDVRTVAAGNTLDVDLWLVLSKLGTYMYVYTN